MSPTSIELLQRYPGPCLTLTLQHVTQQNHTLHRDIGHLSFKKNDLALH